VCDSLINLPWQYIIGANTSISEECHRPTIVQPYTLQLLKKLLSEEAAPTSSKQAKILQLVLDH
jgi:hypothetical protein